MIGTTLFARCILLWTWEDGTGDSRVQGDRVADEACDDGSSRSQDDASLHLKNSTQGVDVGPRGTSDVEVYGGLQVDVQLALEHKSSAGRFGYAVGGHGIDNPLGGAVSSVVVDLVLGHIYGLDWILRWVHILYSIRDRLLVPTVGVGSSPLVGG